MSRSECADGCCGGGAGRVEATGLVVATVLGGDGAEVVSAYAWVKCEWEEDVDYCETLPPAAGGGDHLADDFDVLLERITDFVDAEKHSRTPVASGSM
uniref:Uncharacterized protein n=1 Tax=Oryza meridionalis TaxID=40149 RepID=A0A0E0C728_9ORYZ